MAVYQPSGSGNVHIDVVLTELSIGFPNNGLVAERLFPSVGVLKQSNKYYIYGREAWLPEADVRAPGTEANEIPGYALSTDSYYASEHALQIPVTDEERQNADVPLAPDEDATSLVTSKILLGREVVMKNLATTTGNYATNYSRTLSGTQQWDDYVNSNPIGDWRTGVRKVHSGLFLEPNAGVIPYVVMSVLEDHPDFIERIKYSERGILTPEIIGAILGMENIVVPGTGIASGNPGQTLTVGYLWGDDVVMAYVPANPGQKIPAYGYEFTWSFGPGTRQVVDRWREDRRKSDLIRCSRRYDVKMTALDSTSKQIAGYLIKDTTAAF